MTSPKIAIPTLAETGEATEEEVINKVAKARQAYSSWHRLSYRARANHLLEVRRKLIKNLDEIVDLIVEETGKVSTEAIVNEILVTCELMSYYARRGEGFLRTQRVPVGIAIHKWAEVRYQPLGVVAVISPWNYPFVLTMGPVATALFAGNTVVLKPSEVTPRVGVAIGRLFASMDEFADIVQVVTGGGKVGQALITQPVDKIAFTGSVQTGKSVMKAAADNLTPVLLELGGKDAMIVLADADLDRAAAGAVWGAFTNCGQTCMAVERVYVLEDVYEPFLNKVVEITNKVREGQGDSADIGALTYERQYDIVQHQLEDALQTGAKVLAGGNSMRVGTRKSISPTVLVEVSPDTEMMQQETFGPLLPITKVSNIEEAIQLANQSSFGLSASVWGKNKKTIQQVVYELKAGSVSVNDVMISYAIPSLPFGGVGASGFGRTHGREGLLEFCAVKAVAHDWLGLKREPHWLPLPRWLGKTAKLYLKARYG